MHANTLPRPLPLAITLKRPRLWLAFSTGALLRCCTLDSPVDLDGDGFDNFEAANCSTVDCDDLNADIHPGAVDDEGDGVDQDCDGVDGVAPVGEGEGEG